MSSNDYDLQVKYLTCGPTKLFDKLKLFITNISLVAHFHAALFSHYFTCARIDTVPQIALLPHTTQSRADYSETDPSQATRSINSLGRF